MSNDREFDNLSEQVLGNSQRNAARWPDDPEWTDEYWEARTRRLLRQVYRAGARAQLDHGYRKQADPADRVRWLADNGFCTEDVKSVLREVEDWREKAAALQGTYGVTDSEIRSMLGEGFHTAFRKAVDSPVAVVIHKLIRDLDPEEWGSVLDFVAGPLITMLREAEIRSKTASGQRAYEQFYRGAGQEPPPWNLESGKIQATWTAIAAAAIQPAGQETTP